jgi:FkbM family methyltransferase
MIRESAYANGLRIRVEAIALSNTAGMAELRILTQDPGRSTIDDANVLKDPDGSLRISMTVPTMRLDDYDLQDVSLIKVDVEGHELAVLQGAERTLRRSMPNLLVEIEERHRAGGIRDVSAFLARLGYEGFFILDDQVHPLQRFDETVHQSPANIGSWKQGWKRRGVYVNNFFFLQAGRADILTNALASANLKCPSLIPKPTK